MLAVHESHPLAQRRSVRLRDLAGERFLSFPRQQVSRLYDHIAALCQHAGFRLEPAQEAVQFPTMLGLVAANTGVAIVPDGMRVLRLPGLRYVGLSDPAAVSTVSIACRADRRDSALVGRFLRVAHETAGSAGP